MKEYVLLKLFRSHGIIALGKSSIKDGFFSM